MFLMLEKPRGFQSLMVQNPRRCEDIKGIVIPREVQGWRTGESTCLPPMWPGFDSQIRRHMWVEFVGSLLCTKRCSPGTPVSPLL